MHGQDYYWSHHECPMGIRIPWRIKWCPQDKKSWEREITKERMLMKMGDKRLFSTSWARSGSVAILIFTKQLHIYDGIASCTFKWCQWSEFWDDLSPPRWCFRCYVHPRDDIDHWITLPFPRPFEYLRPLISIDVHPWCNVHLRRSYLGNNFFGDFGAMIVSRW